MYMLIETNLLICDCYKNAWSLRFQNLIQTPTLIRKFPILRKP